MNLDAGTDQICSLALKGDIDSQVELGWKHYEGGILPLIIKLPYENPSLPYDSDHRISVSSELSGGLLAAQ